MKPKQKRILAALIAANVVLILGLVLWVMLALNASPSPTPTSTCPGEGVAEASASPVRPPGQTVSTPINPELGGTPSLSTTSSLEACQWKAAQLLAHVGLDGAVALTADGTLRFDIAYKLSPGQEVDEAAQSIWPAFDVAQALVEDECDLFTQIEVVVLAQGNQTMRTSVRTSVRISARVSTADLVAFDAGELSEDEFTRRVDYQVSSE
jgi:hypothetical protein